MPHEVWLALKFIIECDFFTGRVVEVDGGASFERGSSARYQEMAGMKVLGTLASHLTYALRGLRRSRGFGLTTMVVIALGVGASTAVFSVVDAVLLRPLPYKEPERLVLAYGEMRRRNVTDTPLSNADFFDLRSGAQAAFEDLAAVRTGRILIADGDDTPSDVRFASATPNLIRLLGGRI